MSKYIRTKYCIFEVNENGETYNGYGCKSKNGTIKIHKKDIIKQADTIEELCDEFRYKFCEGDGKWYDKDEDITGALSEKEILTIRGGIWTSKGLIYVAKMNEKGELELL